MTLYFQKYKITYSCDFLSAKDNKKLIKLFRKGFERSVFGKENRKKLGKQKENQKINIE